MIREPSFLKKKKLSQLPPWMECWGKLLCWVSLFCKKFIIDLMFCWTTLKKKKTSSVYCAMKNRFCFPTPAARSAVALHTANLQQAIEASSCARAPRSPTGSQGGALPLPTSHALKSAWRAVPGVMPQGPGWGRARWARLWGRRRWFFKLDGEERDPSRMWKLKSTWEESLVGDTTHYI